ncbi:hypothetical protein QTP88_001451 [Uroleucon formosanum]
MFDYEKLIIEVESKPCLWNIGDSNYHSKHFKALAWTLVCATMYYNSSGNSYFILVEEPSIILVNDLLDELEEILSDGESILSDESDSDNFECLNFENRPIAAAVIGCAGELLVTSGEECRNGAVVKFYLHKYFHGFLMTTPNRGQKVKTVWFAI